MQSIDGRQNASLFIEESKKLYSSYGTLFELFYLLGFKYSAHSSDVDLNFVYYCDAIFSAFSSHLNSIFAKVNWIM